MLYTALAATALAVTSVNAMGSAIVVNKCDYEVYLYNTPASGGGYSEIDKTLSTGGTYEQQYTELSNSQGWSIKLSKSTDMSNIMQYEYTTHDDGTIWYDLSDVNGNPWNGNWEITATGDCTPKQQAYQYATDDAYGMQACPDSSTITVTLCSGDSGSGSGSSPVESSPAASSTTEAPTPTSTYEAPTETATTPAHTHTWGHAGDKVEALHVKPKATTLVTKASTFDEGGVTVTQVQTAVVTQFVTATAGAEKRHEHHARHPHRVRA